MLGAVSRSMLTRIMEDSNGRLYQLEKANKAADARTEVHIMWKESRSAADHHVTARLGAVERPIFVRSSPEESGSPCVFPSALCARIVCLCTVEFVPHKVVLSR
jgi:hypothetical protein